MRAVRVDILNARLRTVHHFHVPASERGQRQPGEVDGTVSSPEGREIYAYGPDGHQLAAAVQRITRTRRLPVGTHLVIESGDTAWKVPLTS